ncbi:hypothetical protein AURANDRAFT_62296 [Aureococcus anophagefferens]|uniref:RCC1-like domain-containing protein n=1 Tax=Aureococcus anophagefferens TaxID=44056 RepID=F0Y1C1_AURAN|nr:hypothetical protein AURANDRAFT_62296 [Aureococcus anophagefferens]EGB10965.1 hypothetical protein AURANDRAFT_62296 [Aureococcus anophagefferens]|eukprot:XP_009034530.1 hypothetical protein AURANDRAFT_62296 [Aureococcus anophagefferens]
MGYAEAMAKIGMRMTKTNLARAEANPKVTITTPKAEPKADDGAAAAPRPTASSPGPKAPSTPSVVGKLLRGADRVGRASTAQAVREFHLKKEMMDFAEDQYALAETHGDQRGKAQRLSVRLQGSEHLAVGGAKSPREAPSSPAAGAADDKLEAALLQLRDVASDAKLLRGEHVAEHQRALTTASGVELLPHRFCFSEEPPLANEMHIVTPGVGEWYAIRLLRRPSHPVRVNMASRSDSILIEPPSVAFAGDGWAEPKHVYARPSWDELRVATHVVRIWHYVVSDDATFHNARVPPLPVHCYKTASPNVLTFGNDDDGQLGSLNRIYPKLDDYNQIELPHELSRAFLDAHRAALDGLDEQDRAKAGVRDYTRHAHHRAHAEGIAADGGASPTSPSKDAAGGLTLSRKQARAMRRAFQELDPDSTNAAYISSDSDVPPDGPAFRRYVAVRLGHRHDEKHATRQGDGHKVLDMAAGGSHSVLACYDGNVYACGANDEGQLGVGDLVPRKLPTLVEFPRDEDVDEGPLYQSIAKHHDRLFTERVVVVAVACGWRHSAAISTNGACFVWGENSNGKLGLGRDVPRAERPTRVLGGVLDGVLVLHVACGTEHTLCGGVDHDDSRSFGLYAWGHRINGALGVPTTFRTDGATRTEAHDMSDLVPLYEPVLVPGSRGVPVRQLACGTFHSAFVDGDGRLLTCGLGDSGQLGRDLRRVAADPVDGTPNRARADARAFTFGPVLLPRRSRLGAARLRCLRVACGGNHTVLLSSSHEVFSFGKGSSGQLGTAELEHRAAPARLDALLDKGVIGIAAGASFSAAWTESGHTYVWGEATAGQLGHAKEHHTSSNVMPLPNLVPILSYARCRSLAFGGSHTLALTEHDTVTVKRMVSNSRAFFNDFRGHARLHRHVAAERKLRDAQRDTRHRDRAARRTLAIAGAEAPGPDDAKARSRDAARELRSAAAHYRADRRVWTKRFKLLKLVSYVDGELIVNRRAQTKVLAAVGEARLVKILRVGPPKEAYLPYKAPADAPDAASVDAVVAAPRDEAPAFDERRRKDEARARQRAANRAKRLEARRAVRDAARLDVDDMRRAKCALHEHWDATRPSQRKLPSAHGVYPVTGLVNRGGQDGLRFAVGALFDFVGAAGLYALRVTSSQLRATYDSELLGYVETLLWDRKEWARRGRASPGTGDASPASPASPVKGAAAPPPGGQRRLLRGTFHAKRMMGNARFLDMMQRTGNNRTTYRPRLSLGPKPARAPRGGPAAPATQESRVEYRGAARPPAGAPRKESVRSRITRRIQTVYTRAEAGRAPRRSDAGAGAASESDGESSSSSSAETPARPASAAPARGATRRFRDDVREGLRAAAAGAPPPGDDGAAEAVDCAYEAFHVAAAARPKRRPDSAPPGGKRRPGKRAAKRPKSAPRKAPARWVGAGGPKPRPPPAAAPAAARPPRPKPARRRPPPAEAPARDADGLAGDGGAAFDAAAGAFVAPVGAAAAFVEVPPAPAPAAEAPAPAREAPAPRDPDLYAGAAVTARPLYAVDASVLRRPEAPAARAADEVHAAKLRLVVAKKKAADARRHGRDVLDVSPYVAGPPGKGHAGNPWQLGAFSF